jgi:hypothetical protein
VSNFLGFDSALVPLGASIADTHNILKTALTSRGWQVLQDDSVTNPTRLDVIPPSSETIGGSGTREFLRIRVATTTITFIPMKQWVNGLPQHVFLYQKTAGAVALTCTLNGATVSYTGGASDTAIQNLIGLYGAIRVSADANFTGFDWELSFPVPQNADDTNTYIYGINKTIAENKTFTMNANVNGGILSNYVAPGFKQDETTAYNGSSVTTDLTNGFIYYLQICARGIALATKTNVGYYGPVHACWASNSTALAYMPSDSQFVSPLEIIVGVDNGATVTDAVARPSHFWLLEQQNYALAANLTTAFWIASPGGGIRRHRFMDALTPNVTFEAGSSITITALALQGSGIFSANTSYVGNDFQVHRIRKITHTAYFNTTLGGYSAPFHTSVVPGFEIDDWYKFTGTATNESLALIADTVSTTTLSSTYTPGDTVLNLTDASSFQSAGFVIVGTEALQYTGKTGNQLTGVTGARYATLATKHYAGDKVSPGLWFTIINGGALLAGYTKPA